jgi:hypothetical protein
MFEFPQLETQAGWRMEVEYPHNEGTPAFGCLLDLRDQGHLHMAESQHAKTGKIQR